MKSISDMNIEELKQLNSEAAMELSKALNNMIISPLSGLKIDVEEDKTKKKWKR